MKRPDALTALAIGAALVIIALTVAAFWLSYEHLAEVAGAHGLGHDHARQWAWPATLDAFVVAGELLMLRAALRHRVDWWAIGLTASGSLASIALNIAGVGPRGEVLDYVVAAVPPVAALLAFGALMRQVHEALARHTATEPEPATATPVVERQPSASRQPAAVPAPAATPALPAPASPASVAPRPAATPAPASPPKPAPAAATATASDGDSGRDLAEVAAAYRQLRATTGQRRPSARLLGEALGVSRSRGQQLRDALESHPDYADEFAPPLKSA